MPKTQLINLMLLPGMDGTGLLFRRFLDVLPADFLAKVISYPPNIPTTYAEAEKIVWEALPHGEDFVLLGESYSGPIALRLAARRPAGLRAVVLVASFAFAPKTMFGAVVSKLGAAPFSVSPPACLVRKFLLGPEAPAPLVAEFRSAIRSVRPQVLAARLRDIWRVDVREELQQCSYPLLCIAASADRLVPRQIYQSMAELRPGMELAVVEGPHCLLQRNPTAVAQRTIEFLKRALAGGSTDREP